MFICNHFLLLVIILREILKTPYPIAENIAITITIEIVAVR